ncbi:MAG: hypothetical protein Q7R94_02560 [bacterium]|nr:hypothetical protein [bacterium]
MASCIKIKEVKSVDPKPILMVFFLTLAWAFAGIITSFLAMKLAERLPIWIEEFKIFKHKLIG